MAYKDDLVTIRDNLAAELKNETARRKALTAAGNAPPTTYSLGGRSYDWNGYLAAMTAQIQALNGLVSGEDLYELHEQGWVDG